MTHEVPSAGWVRDSGPEVAAAVPDSDSGVAAGAEPISAQSPSRAPLAWSRLDWT